MDPALQRQALISLAEDYNNTLVQCKIIKPTNKMTREFLCAPTNEQELGTVEFTDEEIVEGIRSRGRGPEEAEEGADLQFFSNA